jgi:hypothetical protein
LFGALQQSAIALYINGVPEVDNVLYFDSVFIIDLLGPTDMPTATWLRDSTLLPAAEKDSTLSVVYKKVDTREHLQSAIADLKAHTRGGHAPILHVEAHGDKDLGLQLPNGDHVAWIEFKDALTEVNIACGLNLLVVMAACSGGYMLKTMQPTERAAAWAIVGPIEDVRAGELREAMAEFYWALLGSLDGRAALDAMNASRVVAEWKFKLYTAEMMFCWVYRYYKGYTDRTVKERARSIAAAAAAVDGLGEFQKGVLRKQAMLELENHEPTYVRFQSYFLMLDLFPENASRFDLSYARCMAIDNPLLDHDAVGSAT